MDPTAAPKKKRAATEAMSPGHLAATTALAPAERRLQHVVIGVDKDFRDAVGTEASKMDLTKDVREIQHVLKQVIQVVTELQKSDFEQEARTVLAIQRVESFDPKINTLVDEDVKIAKDLDKMGDHIKMKLNEFEREINGKDKLLYGALGTQEAIINERIEEIKNVFLKCDEVFAKKGEVAAGAAPTPKATEAWPPVTTGAPSLSASALKALVDDGTLLRGSVDALQVEINQIRGEILECQNSRVPAELSLQQTCSQLESFQTWTLQEVLEGRNRDIKLTDHVKVAIDEVRLQVIQMACPCTPQTCKGCPKDKKTVSDVEKVFGPWGDFLKKDEKKPDKKDDGPGGDGGGGPDGGGGGGGDNSPDRFGIYSEEGDEDMDEKDRKGKKVYPLTKQSKSPFDSKDAKDLPRYNGKDKLVIWRKKVT